MSAFPVRESGAVTDFGSDATTHNVSMPATVNPGDLLLAIAAFDTSSTTITTPSGWTRLGGFALDPVIGIYAKVAIGNEDSATVDFATNNSQRGSVHVFRFSSWSGSLDGIRMSLGFTASGWNNAGLILGTVSRDVYWLVAQAKSTSGTWSGTPGGYSDELKSGAGEDTTLSASIASAGKASNAASEVAALWDSGRPAMLLAIQPIGALMAPRASFQLGV